jgi:hypothetical protein
MIAFARGLKAGLVRRLAGSDAGVAVGYRVAHPMGVLRLMTPAEYEALARATPVASATQVEGPEVHGESP